jgi:hypothetical protein
MEIEQVESDKMLRFKKRMQLIQRAARLYLNQQIKSLSRALNFGLIPPANGINGRSKIE